MPAANTKYCTCNWSKKHVIQLADSIIIKANQKSISIELATTNKSKSAKQNNWRSLKAKTRHIKGKQKHKVTIINHKKIEVASIGSQLATIKREEIINIIKIKFNIGRPAIGEENIENIGLE